MPPKPCLPSISLTSAPDRLPQELLQEFDEIGSDLLGEGAFALVRKVRHKQTGQVMALKMVEKYPLRIRNMILQMNREVRIQGSLEHKHILQLIKSFEDETYFFMIMEYCAKGPLRTIVYTAPEKRLSEEQAGFYFGQILEGVEWMHHCQCVHRDLKLENMLLTDQDEVKICDFGWSAEIEVEKLLKTLCGTTAYWAPEMFESAPQNAGVDLWALGCLLYEMIVGHPPFWFQDMQELKRRVLAVEFGYPPWLSNEACHVVHCLIQREPQHRVPCAQLLQHPWVLKHRINPAKNLNNTPLDEVLRVAETPEMQGSFTVEVVTREAPAPAPAPLAPHKTNLFEMPDDIMMEEPGFGAPLKPSHEDVVLTNRDDIPVLVATIEPSQVEQVPQIASPLVFAEAQIAQGGPDSTGLLVPHIHPQHGHPPPPVAKREHFTQAPYEQQQLEGRPALIPSLTPVAKIPRAAGVTRFPSSPSRSLAGAPPPKTMDVGNLQEPPLRSASPAVQRPAPGMNLNGSSSVIVAGRSPPQRIPNGFSSSGSLCVSTQSLGISSPPKTSRGTSVVFPGTPVGQSPPQKPPLPTNTMSPQRPMYASGQQMPRVTQSMGGMPGSMLGGSMLGSAKIATMPNLGGFPMPVMR